MRKNLSFVAAAHVVGSTKVMDSLPEGIVLIAVFCGSVHEGHQEQRFARQGVVSLFLFGIPLQE